MANKIPHLFGNKKARPSLLEKFGSGKQPNLAVEDGTNLKTVGDIMDIKNLAAQGLNKTQIARRLGIDRGTVAKYLALDEIPGKGQ